MKQILAFTFLLISMQHHAQITSGLSTPVSGFTSPDVKVRKDNSYKTAYINNVPMNVMKDFSARFGDQDVSWFVEDKEVTGCFYEEDVYHIIYYKSGRYLKTRSVYNGLRLATEIHDFLGRELGKEYKVNLVTEVKWEDQRVYEISLMDDKKICVVKIVVSNTDEELSIVEKTFLTKG
ncbi:MAG TPA: hypothetical protein VGO58_20435 [Chitinophagaceae bacterium]|jgi:hypothetical protein|nr:hypothetical protein [Chitinophagaceae bacterium]